MKKLVTLMLVLLTLGLFASEVQNINGQKPSGKGWIDYSGDPWYLFDGSAGERAVYYNAEDFGFEYPINFYAVQALLYEDGVDFHFKIYAKDGTTVIWEQAADSVSVLGTWQMTEPDSPVILTDDFYIALTGSHASGPAPITVTDEGTGSSCNSYYGVAGNWTRIDNFFGGELRNHSMLVYVEANTDTDIFPPIIRSIAGNKPFMDTSATIVLDVMDKTGTVEPVVGEWTIDGGGTWTPFNLTSSKSTISVIGTIPAQIDGTIGAVRFTMTDSLANSGMSDEYEISWSKDNPILSESFEGTFEPIDWTQDTAATGGGFVKFAKDPTFTNVRTGNSCLAHLDDEGAQDDWIITPVLNIPAANSCTFSFWEVGLWIGYLQYHEVSVTTDGGGTWEPVYVDSLSPRPIMGEEGDASTANITYELAKKMYSLKAYAGQSIQIGWRYIGDYTDHWYIDDIEVIYDYEGPIVADIVGNEALRDSVGIGAFLNNDLVVSLTANDLSGVKSVTGYYTYDGGAIVDTLTFSAAKAGDEIWTATIPAEAAPIAGTISFDLVDIGDIASPTTMDYDFEFVGDGDGPDYEYVTGTLEFVGNPMNLTVFFSDESAITSCGGSYSKDNWTSQYDFVLTPSKTNEYTYVGTIPAEAADVLDGEVIFTIGDAAGNFTVTDPETVIWKSGQRELFEDFETGTDGWFLGGNWAEVEENEYSSATHALTESPGGNYADDETSAANLITALDWSSYLGAEISFSCKYDIEHAFDYMYFEVTTDNGVNWTTIKAWDGEGIDWHQEFISLDAFVGTSEFNFRFKFVSDQGYNANGMYIDDIDIVTYNVDYAAPLPIYTAPAFYEGVIGEFTDTVEILEVTGVDAVEVVWSVNNVPETNVVATLVAGDIWTFTLPAQIPGSIIEYQFWTRDTSPLINNKVNENVYTIIAGEHMVYDNDIVSHYQTLEDGNAIVVKITVPESTVPDTTYSAELTYLLYRMYADTGNQSDPMTVRVWQDDGTGQPGVEILAPIDIIPAANAHQSDKVEMIDLTSYGLTVYGDFYVGYSSDIGIVYGTGEKPSDSGGVDYGVSYDGTDDGAGGWTWALTSDNNYNMRAVLGNISATGIENNNMPLVTALEQNYPNPFNPTTTINFTIASEAKVSLVVYDVMGRAVAKLVDGNLSQGSHKVSFDASSMVSGVYYYNLKSGNVNQTKKMMLIK